jgi:ribosome recycling factor
MEEELLLYMEDAEDRMNKALSFLEHELSKLRAGKANPALLEGIKVNYYGTDTPLSQVANVSIPDAKTIAIQPWEKNLMDAIEKAILAANIGMTPMNNGELIRINIPALTEERRKELVKVVKSEGEAAKVAVRSIRKHANDEFKRMKKDGLAEDLEKDAESNIQKMTDKYIAKIDEVIINKEKEILKV